jgi:hypothetical protein
MTIKALQEEEKHAKNGEKNARKATQHMNMQQ